MKKIREYLNKNNFQSGYVLWLWNYTKPFLSQILLLLLIGFVNSGISISLAIITKHVIDTATSGKLDTNEILLYIAMVIITIALAGVTTVISVILDEKFSFGIRKNLYEKVINSKWLDIAQYHTGDLMTRLTSDSANIAQGIIYTIPNILNLIVQLTITFFVLFYYEPLMAIVGLIIAPIAAILSFYVGRKMKRLQVKVQETEASYRSFLQESLSHIVIIKSFCHEELSTEKLANLREERFFWVKKRSYLNMISSSIMALTFQLGYIIAFSFGSFQVAKGAITFGTMTVFLTLVNRVQAPIFELAKNIPRIISMIASLGRVIELQNISLENKKSNNVSIEQVGVKINKMSFRYGDDEYLFETADTHIHPGEFVAIVGESGIGKTTLIRLIMSFLDPEEGSIKFTDANGNKATDASANVREFISYVPQGNTLFSGSIKDNILMGNFLATDQEIEMALRVASAYEFVNGLPKGIDTVIGEKGHGISEGQAQRIAIARALVKGAPVLILDEATSALDERTEIAVLKGIQSFTPRPTCLMITHRHSVLDYCDRELSISKKKMNLRELDG